MFHLVIIVHCSQYKASLVLTKVMYRNIDSRDVLLLLTKCLPSNFKLQLYNLLEEPFWERGTAPPNWRNCCWETVYWQNPGVVWRPSLSLSSKNIFASIQFINMEHYHVLCGNYVSICFKINFFNACKNSRLIPKGLVVEKNLATDWRQWWTFCQTFSG